MDRVELSRDRRTTRAAKRRLPSRLMIGAVAVQLVGLAMASDGASDARSHRTSSAMRLDPTTASKPTSGLDFRTDDRPSGSHSLHFERDGQIAVIPYQKPLDVKELTLEAWIKVEPNSHFYSYVVSRNYGNLGYGIALHGRPIKVFSQAEATAVPIGRWIHVAAVVSDKAQKFYVDGELASALARDGFLRPFEHELLIGNSDFSGSPGNEPTGFRGYIAEVRIWSIPRTQAQIKKAMGRYLRGTERGLLAYFPLVEGKGQVIHDYTGHLMSGCLGRSYLADPTDPTWADGIRLKGRLPRIHGRR